MFERARNSSVTVMTNSPDEASTNRRSLLAKGALLGVAAVGASAAAAAPAVAQRNERYARGMAMLRAVSGDRATEVVDALSNIAPDLGRYLVEFAYGDTSIHVRGSPHRNGS